MQHEQLYEVVWLRVFACFFVVFLHAGAPVLHSFGTGWEVAAFYSAIARPCVPVFLMLTGYLMLNREDTPIAFYKKKYLKILIPFVFYSFLYYLVEYSLGNKKSILGFFPEFINEPTKYHLWYLYTLVGIYAAFPFIQKVFNRSSQNELRGIIIFWTLLGIALPTLRVAFNVKISFMGIAQFSWFSSLLTYVFVGGYIRKFHKQSQFYSWVTLVAPVLMFIAAVSGSIVKGYADESYFRYELIFVFLYSVSIFHLFIKFCKKEPNMIVTSIASCSFGIYLIHVLILVLLKKSGITGFIIHPVIGIPICAALAFTGSYLCIYYARKVRIVRHLSG